MTDHFVEENGGRYVKHLADSEGRIFTYYVLYSGKLIRCEEETDCKDD